MGDRKVLAYSPTGILGYGYNESSLRSAIARGIDVIAVDAGSSDPGPNYLATGESFAEDALVKRDLGPLLEAAIENNIPLIIGTAGGSGGEPHLQGAQRMVEELAKELQLTFKMAVIHSEQPVETIVKYFQEGRIRSLWPVPDTNEDAIRNSTRIVGLMGAEPYIRALDDGAQVILAGRSDDAAVSAGFLIRSGVSLAQAWLAGRFLECAGACAVPRHGFGYDGLLATVDSDELILESLDPRLACTPQSVAAFLLHENQSPIYHVEPNGILDLSNLSIDPIDDRRVVLRGAQFQLAEKPSIRLEGVELVGFRTLNVGWTRDPVLLNGEIGPYLDRTRERVVRNVSAMGLANEDEYQLLFRLVGKDAVMGDREPSPVVDGHELGILIDTVATTAEASHVICAAARQAIKNAPYPGKQCDEGCVTFPYSPSEIAVGAVYRYHLWHVVEQANFDEMFPIEYTTVG
jgi:hypothetical protein